MRRQMNPMGANMAFDAEAEFKKEHLALAAVRDCIRPHPQNRVNRRRGMSTALHHTEVYAPVLLA